METDLTGYTYVGDKWMLITLCWWQFLGVGDANVKKTGDVGEKTVKTVTKISKLLPIDFVFNLCHRTDRAMWLVRFWENISKLYQRSAKVKLERNTRMSVLCWTSLCYDLRLQNLANDAFPRDIELVDHRIMLSAVTKGFRHLLTWPFSRSEFFLEICVQICSNLNSHLVGSAIRAIKHDLHF